MRKRRRDYKLLGNGAGMTLQEIADELGISSARVQQILRSGLQKLCAHEMTILLKMKEEASGLQSKYKEERP